MSDLKILFTFIFIIFFIPLLIVIIKTIIKIGKNIQNNINRRKFILKYDLTTLPPNIHIKIDSHSSSSKNHFELRYPYWLYEKKDGTADLRINDNHICWQKSTLYIDNFVLSTKRPYVLLEVVKILREKKVQIDLCPEEVEKYNDLCVQQQLLNQSSSISSIVNYFSQKPTDFEYLCAELFAHLGYTTKVTSKTNDGGYDIKLDREGLTSIVECKCYQQSNRIGRPVLQKLVGANSIAHADKMFFITTSDFSSAAIEYANHTGIELINGVQLMAYFKKYLAFDSPYSTSPLDDWSLEAIDLYPYIPDDIFYQYFYN